MLIATSTIRALHVLLKVLLVARAFALWTILIHVLLVVPRRAIVVLLGLPSKPVVWNGSPPHCHHYQNTCWLFVVYQCLEDRNPTGNLSPQSNPCEATYLDLICDCPTLMWRSLRASWKHLYSRMLSRNICFSFSGPVKWKEPLLWYGKGIKLAEITNLYVLLAQIFHLVSLLRRLDITGGHIWSYIHWSFCFWSFQSSTGVKHCKHPHQQRHTPCILYN